jgi:hypothetical protein
MSLKNQEWIFFNDKSYLSRMTHYAFDGRGPYLTDRKGGWSFLVQSVNIMLDTLAYDSPHMVIFSSHSKTYNTCSEKRR